MVSLDPSPHRTPNFQESLPISIYVGKGIQQHVFYAHELLLTTTSDSFRTALQSNFIEGQQKKCHFPEDDPRTFHAFVQYLYGGCWDLRLVQPSSLDDWQEWHVLRTRCFVLANKLLAASVKKYAVYRSACFLQPAKVDQPTMSTMLTMSDIVYRGTLPKDGGAMRDLLAAYCASRLGTNGQEARKEVAGLWDTTDRRALAESQQVEFIADVMCKVRAAPSLDLKEFMSLHYPKA